MYYTKPMENIIFELEGFKAVTYVKGNPAPKIRGKAQTARKGDPIRLETADEVPLFFFCKDRLLGALSINKDQAIALDAKKLVKTSLVSYSLNPADVCVYIGPCLTFSHTHVSREQIINIINLGYGGTAKRTDGIDFLDVPLLVLLQMRELGIPMKNIYVSPYDTFENPDLLYSELAGDKEKNLTIATLE